MPIICVSGCSYTRAGTIAHGVAARLGYDYLDQEVFEQAAERSRMPLETIHKAFDEGPSLFGMSLATRKRCVAGVQAALADRFLAGDLVYWGPYGHLLVRGVSHVLKVRITAQVQDRVALKLEHEGGTVKAAEKQMRKEDERRAAITRLIFGVVGDDADLFDLVVDAAAIDAAAAVDLITETAGQKRYQPMTYSLRCLRNLELGYRVRAALADLDPDVRVQAEDGKVRIQIRDSGGDKSKRRAEIEQRAQAFEEVEQVAIVAVKEVPERNVKRAR